MQDLFRWEHRFSVHSLWSRARLLPLRHQHQEMSHLQQIIKSSQDLQGVRRIDICSRFGYDKLVRSTTYFGKNTVIRCCVDWHSVAPQKIDQTSH